MERYRTIVADPPWDYGGGFWTTSHNPRTGWRGNPKRTPLPYPSMSVSEIERIPVADWADTDAFLWLWTTNRYLPDAFRVVEAWGFEYRQIITWRKSGDGGGSLPAAVAPIHSEHLLACRRGRPRRTGVLPSSVIDAPRGRQHSAKPETFLDLVESVSPGPYLEMFSRRARLGWDTWGNESLHGGEAA